jgi:hypothetical protein
MTQIGIITLGGRQVGVVNYAIGEEDKFTPGFDPLGLYDSGPEAPLGGYGEGRHQNHGGYHYRSHDGHSRESAPSRMGPVKLKEGDDPRGLEGYIRERAKAYGHDPDTAVAVAKSEGLSDPVGDHGTSFGAFQLHKHGGLGDEFQKETGLDPADPKNEKATIDWAMKNLGRTGWGPYHGARNRYGLGNWEGVAGGEEPSGSGDGHANMMHGQYGGVGENIERVTTKGGHAFAANSAAARPLKGFVEDLEAAGAPIKDIGSYNPRKIAGTNRWSQHAYGNAIDIDQYGRGVVAKPFGDWARANPDKLNEAARKWGIINGASFGDFGHFEWGGGERAPPSAPPVSPPAAADRPLPAEPQKSSDNSRGLRGTYSNVNDYLDRLAKGDPTVPRPSFGDAPTKSPE